jgi:hypothetical protein
MKHTDDGRSKEVISDKVMIGDEQFYPMMLLDTDW